MWLRATTRKALEPLLPTAARDAIQVIDEDEQASATLKKSVRSLLVDQREFSSTFFTKVDREIDTAFDELFREGADKQPQPQDKPEVRAGGLSLVGYDQMEENMMLDRFAARIRNSVEEQFNRADPAAGGRAQDARSGRSAEPISPDALLQARSPMRWRLGLQGRPAHGRDQGL